MVDERSRTRRSYDTVAEEYRHRLADELAGKPLDRAVHLGAEVRHLDEWWGHPVDVDFHFFAAETVVAALAGAGFTVEARMERVSYPQEVETRRLYLLARNAG